MRGWSTVLLPEPANPPGGNGGSWPEYMTGTLWADKVLPGHRTKAYRTKTNVDKHVKTTDKRHASPRRVTQTHPHTDKKTWRKTNRKSGQKF